MNFVSSMPQSRSQLEQFAFEFFGVIIPDEAAVGALAIVVVCLLFKSNILSNPRV